MNILTLFTPEVALLFFAFLVLFFVSITYPAPRIATFALLAYAWRMGALAIADALSLVPMLDPVAAEYAMAAGDIAFAFALYWLFAKAAVPGLERMHWLATLMLNCALAGFVVSSLFILFPLQTASVLPRVGVQLFSTPLANSAWFFAPIALLALLRIAPRKTVRRKVKVG